MGIVAAYVVPHPASILPTVGRGREIYAEQTIEAYREIVFRIAAHAPDVVAIVSSHAPYFRDCFHLSTGNAGYGDLSRFGIPEESMRVSFDDSFIANVASCSRKHVVPVCGSCMQDRQLDIGTFVPLWFINQVYSGYRVVRAGISGMSVEAHRSFGCCLAETADDLDKSMVLLASGNLSSCSGDISVHEFIPEGSIFDKTLMQLFESGNLDGLFSLDPATVEPSVKSSLKAFQVMAGALDKKTYSHELLSYEEPFGVGYAVSAFEIAEPPLPF